MTNFSRYYHYYRRCYFFRRFEVTSLVDVKTKSIMTKTYDRRKSKTKLLEDNPCWGGPTRHGLSDLLFLIHRNKSIVFDSPQYLVYNKSPDLRMDGAYPATVHKLLTYWYPSPSLLNDYKQNGISNHTLLLELVSQLHQHNDIPDNFLRPCHQLDYATSGVLLVAKTKQAASHVSRLLEDRHEGIEKTYTAMVVGDLLTEIFRKDDQYSEKNNKNRNQNNGHILKIPIWKGGDTIHQVRKRLQKLEEKYRRARARVGKQHRRVHCSFRKDSQRQQEQKSSFTRGTFPGYQPAHSIFLKWKSEKMKLASGANTLSANTHGSPKKKRLKRNGSNNSNTSLLNVEDWQRIWEPVREVEVKIGGGEGVAVIDIQKLVWKKLSHPELKKSMIQAADIHNDILREAIRKKEEEEVMDTDEGSNDSDAEFPTFFRLSGSGNCTQDLNDTGGKTFYIFCPLAQDPDHFPMIYKKDRDTKQLDFKPSLTKCTVLEQGKIAIKRHNIETNIDVTKVILHPITGRRHQLRVHMALTGYPILGDSTYGEKEITTCKIDDDNSNQKKYEDNTINGAIRECSRMCLHAQSLQLPSLLGEKKLNWKVTTPDPFVIGEDGMLQLD